MALETSIFKTIKALLGPDANYDVFDQDILIFINSAIMTLIQLGVGPASGFRVTGEDETWEDFIGDRTDLEAIKSYVYMKVRLGFDPPSNSSVANAYEETCKEIEWRLNIATDPPNQTWNSQT